MIKYIVVLCALIISLNTLHAQPKLYIIGGDTVNWGKVRLDESPLTKRLSLINIGTDTLKFLRVNPSCGCTTAPIDKMVLGTGDTAHIDVTFNLPTQRGRAHKIINISTNEPDNRYRVVHLVADVVFPLSFFPGQQFSIPGVAVGDTVVTRIVVNNSTDEDIIVKDVALSPAILSVNLKNDMVIPAKKDLTIDLTVIPTELGIITGELQFKTDHPDVVRVKIPVVVNVQGVKPMPKKPIKY